MTSSRSLVVMIAVFGGFSISLPAAAVASDIVALGASNTEGKGRGRTPDCVPRSQAYHAQLQQMLRSGGCSASVTHAAIAGNTTGQMLKRRHGVVKPSTRVLNL
jgi:acyl-CoA thioesterase-1